MTTTIRHVAIAVVLGFAIISLDLIYWQVIRAPDLNSRTGNPRAAQAAQQIDRGLILDRHGIVLAQSVRGKDGTFSRQYALQDLSPIIGYASARFGTSGVEKSYKSQLEGSGGDLFANLANLVLQRPQVGDTLTLSIDAKLQQTADQALGSVSGAAVVIKPQTGEVLAMVSKPYFNANDLDNEIPRLQNSPTGALLNRATQGLYPPGSVFKMVTVSAGLANGTMKPDTKFQQAGDTFTVDGFVVRGSNLPAGLVNPTLTQAFQYSCNPCFAQLGLMLGWPKLTQQAEAFGIDKTISFDEPVATSTLHDSGADLSRVLLANTAYGQGQLQVTPLQMALIGAAVANDGTMPQPHLVLRETTRGGQAIGEFGGGSLGSPLDGAVAGTVRDLMVTVVQSGSGVLAQIPGTQVAGKTGTAETGNGQPTDAWFVAFAPANQPKYVVAVIREHMGEGYDQAAPMAKTMLQAALASGD
ncbi:MAG: penicillin-binding protein 2 [Chloroflexi bacterium]|nr:penicillin-binding protein 2 [Chloroflexota bacterium]